MAHHIAVTLWVAGFFDIPRIGRNFFFRDLTRILSMKINGNFPFQFTFYLLISLSQLHSKWSDLWRWHLVFLIFFYFTDILTQFNRISPSCVTKRYHFMDVKRIFLLKEISSTFFFYQMSIYLILTNMYTNKLLRTKRTP